LNNQSCLSLEVYAYSTITDWVRQVANVVTPLGHLQLHEMYQQQYWHGDETGIAVLDNQVKKDTHQGYYWTYLTGDGRLIYFDYHRGRDKPAAENILQHFKGHLQVDGYEVYDKLNIKGMIIFFCMSHARRKFYDSKENDKARAEHVLTEIAKLYKVEEECKEQRLDEEQIKIRRAEKSLPILKSLGAWMKQEYVKLRPKSPIAQAMAYSIKRWEGLSLYATTGHLHIDNNPIERCMKNLAVGRKNYLFCGSHEAAKRAGLLYSLLVSCKLNNVNPYEWLKDVLSHNINELTTSKLKSLLPHRWKKQESNTTP
jgi:transposase